MRPTISEPRTANRLDAQRRANERLWARKSLVQKYANRVLFPAEVLLLIHFRAELSGRVLELGCGAGRLTGYLGEIASMVHGIDISPEMIAYSRRTYPKLTFSEGDLRDVASMARGSFDAVVAGCNVLDVLGDAERRQVLDGIHRVLPVSGLLIMSSHNLAHASRVPDPLQIRSRGLLPRIRKAGLLHAAAALARWPLWQFNRRRLLRFERSEPGYSILNDYSHDYMGLHYYISRDAQESQLREHGFELVECFDVDGRRIEPGDDAPSESWLHYVARKRPDGDTP